MRHKVKVVEVTFDILVFLMMISSWWLDAFEGNASHEKRKQSGKHQIQQRE